MRYPQVLDELEPRHFHRLGQNYLDLARMHRVEGTARFIDKMPNNFPLVGFIHAILPGAKIIDARRHPLDACTGNLRQLYARGQTFSYDQTDIGEYYLQYQRMMDHWDQVLPGKVLHVQYEDVVADLETQVRRILTFLELPFEDSLRATSTTPSARCAPPVPSRCASRFTPRASATGATTRTSCRNCRKCWRRFSRAIQRPRLSGSGLPGLIEEPKRRA